MKSVFSLWPLLLQEVLESKEKSAQELKTSYASFLFFFFVTRKAKWDGMFEQEDDFLMPFCQFFTSYLQSMSWLMQSSSSSNTPVLFREFLKSIWCYWRERVLEGYYRRQCLRNCQAHWSYVNHTLGDVFLMNHDNNTTFTGNADQEELHVKLNRQIHKSKQKKRVFTHRFNSFIFFFKRGYF